MRGAIAEKLPLLPKIAISSGPARKRREKENVP